MKIIVFFLLFSFNLSGLAQVGINTSNPHPSSMLELNSTISVLKKKKDGYVFIQNIISNFHRFKGVYFGYLANF